MLEKWLDTLLLAIIDKVSGFEFIDRLDKYYLRSTWIVMFSLLTSVGYSQYTYFNDVIGVTGDNESECSRDIELIGDRYYSWGAGVDGEGYFYFFREHDEEGLIINENSFHRPGEFIWYGAGQGFKKVPGEDTFIFSGSIVDSISTKGFIMKINSDLDTLWTKRYDIYPPDTYFITHTIDGDGFVLAGEYGIGPGERATFIAKIDFEGELLWHDYLHLPFQGVFRNLDISAVPTGYVVSGASGSGGDTEGRIEYTDSQGNLMFYREGIGGLWRGNMRHTVLTSGEILAAQGIGHLDFPDVEAPFWTYNLLRLSILDIENQDLNTVADFFEQDNWLSGYPQKVMESQGGIIVIGGFRNQMGEWNPIESFILKLSDTYEIEWYTELAYNSCTTCTSQLYDVQEAPDGGYTMTGYFSDLDTDPIQKTWQVKVDACGDLEWQGCELPSGLLDISAPPVDPLLIYPNPISAGSSTLLFVGLAEGLYTSEIELIEMHDVMGRSVQELSLRHTSALLSTGTSALLSTGAQGPFLQLNLAPLRPGIYSLTISTIDGRIYSEKLVVD